MTTTCDILIIGGGVIGVTVALELKRRRPADRIILLDKEPATGAHASGRNSGVLHAGFYYSADSLKAKFCRDGNRELRAYIRAKNLPLNECGKLVVAQDEAQLSGLDELARRGERNGVPVELISLERARQIEPRVKTAGRALWSPSTASADPRQVIAALVDDARAAGIDVRLGTAYERAYPGRIDTSGGPITAGYVVNCAGLYADRIAKDFGFCQDFVILPFKGLYLYSSEPAGRLKTNIYPVPDLKYPFLGVHYTVTVDGHMKIGPTAMPAFWREHYDGFENFSFRELWEVCTRELGLFLWAGFDFRGLAVQEMKKISRTYLAKQAAHLIEGVDPKDYVEWGRPGIRAQLLDVRKRTLVMDFALEGDAKSFHVLNAVSPAWTCSLPFARHVCDALAQAGGPSRTVAD